ncbi:hypothetical protein [Mycolicibacterium iranicum]|uniref:hypothetical protein n=1 Tax=Mycolicibacterium iranicum TaxID=912594 RepID=UPI00046375E0|nr:hypothetical protein [Mycolicibacterium iranicum]
MGSTFLAVAIVATLLIWHRRNRRHPGWHASDAGRFYVYCGYSLVAVAGYLLCSAPHTTTWEWAFGNLWTLAAMVSLVWGFESLNRAAVRHAEIALQIESIAPTEAAAQN